MYSTALYSHVCSPVLTCLQSGILFLFALLRAMNNLSNLVYINSSIWNRGKGIRLTAQPKGLSVG